jgi:O-antigen/teichoic acid export membrane protein
MNTIALLTNGINNLWFWTYGIIAGWGITVTLVIAAIIFVAVRHLKLTQQVATLNNRLVILEREFNLSTKTWPGKK